MEFKEKHITLIKYFFVVVFTGTLFYWSSIGAKKYYFQPIATYLSYTRGDDNYKVNYPHVTWCNPSFVTQDADLNQCRGNESDFVPALKNCLTSNNFSYKSWKNKLEQFHVNQFILRSTFNTRTKDINIEQLFEKKFNPIYGQCIELDSEKVKATVRHGKTSIQTFLNFTALKGSKSGKIFASFHPKLDGPDALDIHPQLWMGKELENVWYYAKLAKRLIVRESTRDSPCGEFNEKACLELQKQETIVQNLKCRAEVLHSGHHLQAYIPGYKDLKYCNEQETLEALKIFLKKSESDNEKCKDANACEKTKFSMVVEKHSLSSNNFGFTFPDAEVEHYTTYISYDEQSLIAEIGGMLGMTLGLSGLSFAFFLADFLQRFVM